MRIGVIIIFHLSKLWKAKFSILCDVIFLERLQGKLEIDHPWECGHLDFESPVAAQNAEFKAVFTAPFHARSAPTLVRESQYFQDELVQCIWRDKNCAQGKQSLYPRRNFISTINSWLQYGEGGDYKRSLPFTKGTCWRCGSSFIYKDFVAQLLRVLIDVQTTSWDFPNHWD